MPRGVYIRTEEMLEHRRNNSNLSGWKLTEEDKQRRSIARKQATADSDIVVQGEEAHIKIGSALAKIDIKFLGSVKKHKWWIDHGYVATHIRGKKLYLHRFVMDNPKSNIDHINGDPLDNRRSNLRLCTQSQNMANVGLSRANKTGYKGVFWRAEKNKFVAQIRLRRKTIYLGYFTKAIDAAKAYDQAAREAWGEFAVLNSGNVTG